MGSPASGARQACTTFRYELADFLQCLRHPRLAPRLPRVACGRVNRSDWVPCIRFARLLQWAAFLWAVNLLLLGPLAVLAATLGGATHRLNIHSIPWLQALIWAPIVEELVFRYALRQPLAYAWLVPVAAVAMFTGPGWQGWSLVACLLLVCWLVSAFGYGRSAPVQWRALGQTYANLWFPRVFHAAGMVFACMHLYNFNLAHTPWWLLPVLVFPQWLTGLVLGWMRVRRSMGSGIALHALFNAGPLLAVWLVLQVAPDWVA